MTLTANDEEEVGVMSRTSITTPCPMSHLPIAALGRRTSTASAGSYQDETEEFDDTRAVRVEFGNARPRRRSTFQRREGKAAPVTIFEDVPEDEEPVLGERGIALRSTLLGNPARKLPALDTRTGSTGEIETRPLQVIGEARRRISLASHATLIETEGISQATANAREHPGNAEQGTRGGLKKEPRRRTIFVPPDDTTILTIHPGANTTDRLNDTFQLPGSAVQAAILQHVQEPEQCLKTAHPVKKPRMSLAVAPKRVPLQQLQARRSNTPSFDVTGQNGGKENVPPRLEADVERKKTAQMSLPTESNIVRARSRLFEPTAASQAKQSVVARNCAPPPMNSGRQNKGQSPSSQMLHAPNAQADVRLHRNLRASPPCSRHIANTRVDHDDTNAGQLKHCPSQRHQGPTESRVGTRTTGLLRYPVLLEDIAQPELYEDSWLGHQEVALTELINEIFVSVARKSTEWQPEILILRKRLIETYNQPRVTILHKRLQASLLYGALSRPEDLSSLPMPRHDLGLRRRFLRLWLDTYNQESLRVAAEVVFGRQLPRESSNSDGRQTHVRKDRRILVEFLQTFLVDVEDVEGAVEEQGHATSGPWGKVLLRSLMLIWLLDRAKTSQAIKGCQFKPTSPYKSSVAVLQTLASMLNPSIGDITRVLRRIDYNVCHVQDPLDEVKYRIDNIAVDLRDGILLTRLVELLLFSSNKRGSTEITGDATITVHMPDLTILESSLYDMDGAEHPRILSQHLKMPVLGRAQKLFNVQLAISALHEHGMIGEGAAHVTANDIVDGHRERTLSLLWAVVSNHGLSVLVDFDELRADIKRAAAGTLDAQNLYEDSPHLSQMQQESLLKKWASVYCARKGMRIGNLTTSFADGKAYSAILDAFTEYIHVKPSVHSRSTSCPTRIEAQLLTFGCSEAFIKQISSTRGTIPSRKTTISNLAFLSSRLLPLARQNSAAVVIQRAFRLKRSRLVASQRVTLMRLAHACATVVTTQNRLVSAATVLQTAWRSVLDARIKGLNRDVERFQAAARSWMVRRKALCRDLGAGSYSRSLRIMGGW